MNELLCAFCLVEQQIKTPAAIMLNGTTVCENHAPEIAEQNESAQRGVDDPMVRAVRGTQPGG